jgi:hypothetical protein
LADELGGLTKAEMARVKAAFEAKLPDAKCVQCGHPDITINAQIVTPLTSQQEGSIPAILRAKDLIQLIRYLPAISTFCPNCGNMQFYSLPVMGVELDPLSSSQEGGDAK